jgi:hypothetical protein
MFAVALEIFTFVVCMIGLPAVLLGAWQITAPTISRARAYIRGQARARARTLRLITGLILQPLSLLSRWIAGISGKGRHEA